MILLSRRSFCKAVTATGITMPLGLCVHRRSSAGQPPNVIMIMVDDLNAWVGNLHKHPLAHTPHIDRLARSGISFSNAHCAAPVCSSSRAAIMTGIYPHKSGFYTNQRSVNAHQAIDNVPHLTELFRSAGYKIIGAGKIYHHWVSDSEDHAEYYDEHMPELAIPEQLLDRGDGYGGIKFYPFPADGSAISRIYGAENGVSLTAGPLDRATDMIDGQMPDEMIADWAVDRLKNKQAQPLFAAIGFLRPHVPYTAPREYFERFPLDRIALPEVDDMRDIPSYGLAMTMGSILGGDHKAVVALGENYWKKLIQGYLASIAFVDAQVGKILDAIDQTGLANNTIVMLLSDHGQNFGEKANWRKMCLWEESTRVPFIIRPPIQKQAGQRCDSAVNLLDISHTLSKLCDIPVHPANDGRDLSPLLDDPHRRWDHPVLIGWRYRNFAVRSNRWRYIRYRDGQEEVYDHRSDPLERNNLIAKSKNDAGVKRLRMMIPQQVALPIGMTNWSGDELDKHLENWRRNGRPKWFGS